MTRFDAAAIAAAVTEPSAEMIASTGADLTKRGELDARTTANRLYGSRPADRADASEATVRAEALRRERIAAVYQASPARALRDAATELQAVGFMEAADAIFCAINRGCDLYTRLISPIECGVILDTISHINTSTSSAIVQAVADNLLSLPRD